MDAAGVLGEDQPLAGSDAEVFTHLGGDDNASCRIDANTGDMGFVGLRHKVFSI